MVLPRPQTSHTGTSRKRVGIDQKKKPEEHLGSALPMTSHHISKKRRISNDAETISHGSDQTTVHHNRSATDFDQPTLSRELNEASGAHQEPEESDEPDWVNLTRQEPSKTNVPKFLEARENLEAAEARFGDFLDEFLKNFKTTQEVLLQIAVDIHDKRREKLDVMETEFKETIVWNDQVRTKMEQRLKETASAAQGLFQQLMMRISNPLRRSTDANGMNNKRTG